MKKATNLPTRDGQYNPHGTSSALTLLNASRPASQSSWLKLAETMTRTRAAPRATIGNTIGEAKPPSSKSLALRQKRLLMARRGGT